MKDSPAAVSAIDSDIDLWQTFVSNTSAVLPFEVDLTNFLVEGQSASVMFARLCPELLFNLCIQGTNASCGRCGFSQESNSGM